MIDLSKLKKEAGQRFAQNKRFMDKLRKKPPPRLDQDFHELHETAFEHIDCLSCANCCKTTGPLFTQKDIERLASALQIKPSTFIETYLRIDEDQDLVLKAVPCPFLGSDNYCSVYDHRPNACRKYPHTDQRKMHTITKETLHNIAICPAVNEIIESLKKKYPELN